MFPIKNPNRQDARSAKDTAIPSAEKEHQAFFAAAVINK